MKALVVGVLSIALLVGVFFAFNSYIYHEKQADQPTSEGQDTDTVTMISTYAFYDEGLKFEYPSGDAGYIITDLPVTADEVMPVRSVRLLPTADYVDEQNREGGEGSPAWVVSVYKNTEKLHPAVWVDRNKMVSNIDMAMDTPKETSIDGANTVAYRIDGLYPTDVYVIAHGGYIFVASVSFIDESSRTFQDRMAWLDSFTFVPTLTRPEGKLDPRAACESALAYMTFPSDAEARAFVEACIAGEHPEVIQRYRDGLNLERPAL